MKKILAQCHREIAEMVVSLIENDSLELIKICFFTHNHRKDEKQLAQCHREITEMVVSLIENDSLENSSRKN